MKWWLEDVLERLSWEIVLKFLLNEVLEWCFFEIVMKWWWKCREGCRVMMMMGRWARPTLTISYIYIYIYHIYIYIIYIYIYHIYIYIIYIYISYIYIYISYIYIYIYIIYIYHIYIYIIYVIYIYISYIYISDIYHRYIYIYIIYIRGRGKTTTNHHHRPRRGGEEERVDKLKGRKDHDHPPGIHIHKVDIQMYWLKIKIWPRPGSQVVVVGLTSASGSKPCTQTNSTAWSTWQHGWQNQRHFTTGQVQSHQKSPTSQGILQQRDWDADTAFNHRTSGEYKNVWKYNIL